MTLRFCDSFDHYATLTDKWTSITGAVAINAAAGRNGTSGLRSSGTGQYVTRSLPAAATYILGFAFTPKAGAPANVMMASFTQAGTGQVDLRLSPDFRIYVQRGATTLATAAAALQQNASAYIEWKVLVSATVGTVQVRVNGAVVINLINQNTLSTATATIDGMVLGQLGTGVDTFDYDDVYVCDTAGVVNNDYLGDVRVEALFPTGPGFYAEFTTLVGAATQWQAVAGTPPDGDVSYIASATPGHRSTFATGNLISTSGLVKAVVINVAGRKDDAGARTVAGIARLAAVDAATGGTALGGTYVIAQEIMEADPSAAAWTIANVNAAEFGPREIA